MTHVTYIEHNGTEHKIDVPNGTSVMRGAFNKNVPGIVGECGGALACATCHCYVDEAWIAKVGTASQTEIEMLDAATSPVKPNSRLSCQITVTDQLEGLVVQLPETQF